MHIVSILTLLFVILTTAGCTTEPTPETAEQMYRQAIQMDPLEVAEKFRDLAYGDCQKSKWHFLYQAYHWPALRETGFDPVVLNRPEADYTGVWKTWKPDEGFGFETEYRDGERTGLYRARYDNGQLRHEYRMVDGCMEGASREWSRDGRLTAEFVYARGKMVGVGRRYADDGRMVFESRRVHGRDVCEVQEWFSNGKVKHRYTTRGDRRVGLDYSYGLDGDLDLIRHWDWDAGEVVTVYSPAEGIDRRAEHGIRRNP